MDVDDIRVQAAIAAMQGIIESGKIGQLLELSPSLVAAQSVRLANALVKELQCKRDNKALDKEVKDGFKKLIHLKEE